ncbi:hypothetical protein GCM10027517_14050 [Phycicoccus ginsengisoli]
MGQLRRLPADFRVGGAARTVVGPGHDLLVGVQRRPEPQDLADEEGSRLHRAVHEDSKLSGPAKRKPSSGSALPARALVTGSPGGRTTRPPDSTRPRPRFRWPGPVLLSQHSARPKGFEPLTF